MGLGIILKMTGQLAPFHMTAKPIDTGFFEPPSIGMPDPSLGGGGGSPFSGIEGLLMNYAMSDAMGSAQQNAKQKVSGVMSGIQSLVSEAFPNFSGGIGSGTVGGGFNSITQPTSPAPFTPAISLSDMGYPAPKIDMMGGDLSHIITNKGGDQSTNDFLTPEQKEQFGITTTNYQGPVSLPVMGPNSNSQTYMGGMPMVGGSGMGNPMAMMDGPMMGGTPPMGPTAPMGPPPMGPMGGPPPMGPPPMSEPAGPPPGVPPVDPSSVGLGGNPMIFQPPMTDPTTINPALTDPPMLPKMFVEESGPVFQDTYNPAETNIDDILAGQGGFPKMDFGPMTAEKAYNPAMEYNFQAPLPSPTVSEAQQQALQQLWNSNMESSPFD